MDKVGIAPPYSHNLMNMSEIHRKAFQKFSAKKVTQCQEDQLPLSVLLSCQKRDYEPKSDFDVRMKKYNNQAHNITMGLKDLLSEVPNRMRVEPVSVRRGEVTIWYKSEVKNKLVQCDPKYTEYYRPEHITPYLYNLPPGGLLDQSVTQGLRRGAVDEFMRYSVTPQEIDFVYQQYVTATGERVMQLTPGWEWVSHKWHTGVNDDSPAGSKLYGQSDHYEQNETCHWATWRGL